ncbi:AAA family ATPase [Flavobacterium bizetiae]|uniref:AAA family ATPase n=1 Tax=Flavobacterium bizetiae TaxID=2704140 RepID=UPI00375772BE
MNTFIITGGPGAGKTTIIEALKHSGYNCVDEVARQIIKEQVLNNGDALPWADQEKYTFLMLERSVATFLKNKDNSSITFFDRGIPDTLSYAHLIKLKIFPKLSEAITTYRYNPIVFILPPWEEIYQTDSERKQTFAEAIEVYNTLKETYSDCEYQLVEVPKLEVKERIDFILSVIERK